MPIMKTEELKYAQVLERLRGQIREGTLKQGDRLPSFNEMRLQFGISRTTIEKVHGLLEQESLIVREHGRGTFVAPAKPAARKTSVSGKRGVIGVFSEAFSANLASQYWAHLLEGIRGAAHDAGLEVTLLHGEAEMTGWEKVDGVLISGQQLCATLRDKPLQLPAVHLLHDWPEAIAVLADDANGARLAVRHLLELGHRRIGYLLLQNRAPLRIRHDAYRHTLREARIRPQAAWTRWLVQPPNRENYFLRLGEDAMTDWLRDETKQGWKATGCTALLCQNDQMAVGAMAALQAHGVEVPRDVSIVGFDGTGISEYCSPRLTTVEVPLREIGARGVELLMKQIESRCGSTRSAAASVVLPVKLKVGASSAPPKS